MLKRGLKSVSLSLHWSPPQRVAKPRSDGPSEEISGQSIEAVEYIECLFTGTPLLCVEIRIDDVCLFLRRRNVGEAVPDAHESALHLRQR